MRSTLRRLWRLLRQRTGKRNDRRAQLAVECLECRSLLSAGFVQTNLVSDVPGTAAFTDPKLLNPWGLSASSGSAFWVSDNNSGFTTLYNGQGQPQPPGTTPPLKPLQVAIPTATPGSLSSPTGTVFNTLNSGFNVSETIGGVTSTGSSIFLFDTEDGLIAGWSPGVDRTHAIVAVDNSKSGAGYKGLAIGTDGAGDTLIYAANFAQNTIDVYDQHFHKVTTLAGNFTDPSIPNGFAPFNIQAINNKLYVEYAKFDPATTEGAPGAGAGFVDVFDTDGRLLTPHHLISGGVLNAPWGVALAPSNFGQFSNDLLVGNFGDGHINAFDPGTGYFLGTLRLPDGTPFQQDDLWALKFGNGAGAGPTNTLFFTAGINDEKDGLLGSLQAESTVTIHAPIVPNLSTAVQQTIPTDTATGDTNPYGVAFVPDGFKGNGVLQPGDLLVSNFNSSSGTQGTGTTIQRVTPDGQVSTFFTSTQIGLDGALGVLKAGFVIVGNLPNNNGTIGQGSLQILDANGKVVATLTDARLLDGPWGLTIDDDGHSAKVFVSNVLSGTVTRIDLVIPDGGIPTVVGMTQIASGFKHGSDPNALVLGPTGLAFDDRTNTLFVASTDDNGIFAISDAESTRRDRGTGKAVAQNDPHLHGPLGLVLAPNGDLIVSNGDAVSPGGTPNDVVEFDRFGDFVGDFQLDKGPVGAAFGLAISTDDGAIRFAAADDNANATLNSATVEVFTLGIRSPFGDLDHHHHHHDHGDGDWFGDSW